MSTERKVDPFSALVLVFSIIALIIMVFLDFGALFYTGYGVRYSCLTCDYATTVDLAAQIITILMLIFQIIIALNDLVPKPFIQKDLTTIGLFLAIMTILMMIIGYIGFMLVYWEFDTWPEIGFYAGIIGGIMTFKYQITHLLLFSFVLLILIIIPSICVGQVPETEWTKIYEGTDLCAAYSV